MVLSNESVKRLVIYFVFDKDGIVDDYIIYMLQALKDCNNEIAVVCNGKLQPEARQRLEEITPTVFARENKGYDVWAYKTMLDYYGWEKLETYDEVVMMNYTIMGPVYPLEEMFRAMNVRDLDFWGITKYHEYKDGDPFGTIECGYIPEHIQSHFIAVRNKMLRSIEFQKYWNEMCEINDYTEAVGCHEAIFTQKFADAGYKWDVYADVKEGVNNHPVLCATNEMIRDKRCPIFKRRSFMHNYSNILNDTYGQETIELMKFLEAHTDYDTGMIWQNMLRLENMADIKKNMQLNYVVSSESSMSDEAAIQNRKTAMFFMCTGSEDSGKYLSHAKAMPDDADIYILTNDEGSRQKLQELLEMLPQQKKEIRVLSREGYFMDIVTELREKAEGYDYICILHDDKDEEITPQTIVEGMAYKNLANLLASRLYVENILKTFEKNPYLGMLMPPAPNHGTYYNVLGAEWGNGFDDIKKLSGELGITVSLKKDKEPIAPLMGMFWARTEALKEVLRYDWLRISEAYDGEEDFYEIVKLVCGLSVQNMGYYPAWVMQEECAAIELTNLHFMLSELNKVIFEEGTGGGNRELVVSKVRNAFDEWLTGIASPTEGIKQTRLYLKCEGAYSEENSFIIRKDANKEKYFFDEFEKYEAVSELRWDPGERAGIKVESLQATIKSITGQKYTVNLSEVGHNGIMRDGRLFFIAKDPQIYIHLPGEMRLKSLEIVAEITDDITVEEVNYIRDKVNGSSGKSLLRRIKHRIFR